MSLLRWLTPRQACSPRLQSNSTHLGQSDHTSRTVTHSGEHLGRENVLQCDMQMLWTARVQFVVFGKAAHYFWLNLLSRYVGISCPQLSHSHWPVLLCLSSPPSPPSLSAWHSIANKKSTVICSYNSYWTVFAFIYFFRWSCDPE